MADHTHTGVLPADQVGILRHALGVGHGGWEPSHRNHFATGNGSAAPPHSNALAQRGPLPHHPARALAGGDHVFCVTRAGRIAAIAAPPKLTPGQRRYAAYLSEDSGVSFGDWLRRESRLRSLELPPYA